ncbi:hypothetical protein CRENBAI_001531 [Crenichthys baileyi]|uniref:Uncharacterized protein n=1 Tax=Crenichthys baileyi TaxID=28760 RepID=A0AAV9SH53_9TELE
MFLDKLPDKNRLKPLSPPKRAKSLKYFPAEAQPTSLTKRSVSTIAVHPLDEPERAAEPAAEGKPLEGTSSSPRRAKSLRDLPAESQSQTPPITRKRAISSIIYDPAETGDKTQMLADSEHQVDPSGKASSVKTLAQQFQTAASPGKLQQLNHTEAGSSEPEIGQTETDQDEDRKTTKPRRNPSDGTDYLTVADERYMRSHRSKSCNASDRKAKLLMPSKEPRASSSERDLAEASRASDSGWEAEKRKMMKAGKTQEANQGSVSTAQEPVTSGDPVRATAELLLQRGNPRGRSPLKQARSR